MSTKIGSDTLSMATAIKEQFIRFDCELEYIAKDSRFSWCKDKSATRLPTEVGVYCLFSHRESRIQKIGKAESTGGLRARFNQYVGKKTEFKLARDQTDQRWRRIMTDQLDGKRLQLFYFLTPPIKLPSPIRLSGDAARQLKCHWARSLENYLATAIRNEYRRDKLLDTHLLLSGKAN